MQQKKRELSGWKLHQKFLSRPAWSQKPYVNTALNQVADIEGENCITVTATNKA